MSDAEIEVIKDTNIQPLKATGPGRELDHKIALSIITILAFVTRFWGISHPNEVVFDEVHFGKFASYSSSTHISSMSILPSASSSLLLWAGWSVMTATSTSITLATRTSRTRSPM